MNYVILQILSNVSSEVKVELMARGFRLAAVLKAWAFSFSPRVRSLLFSWIVNSHIHECVRWVHGLFWVVIMLN